MMAWTDFSSNKDAKIKFDYTPGEQVDAFTMVKSGNYLLISRESTSQDATPVDGVAGEDWDIIGYSGTPSVDLPYINVVRTQDVVNTFSVVGTGDAKLWPPAAPQPLTGGNYEGYIKVGDLFDNGSSGMSLIGGIDQVGAPCIGCDVRNDIGGIYRVDGFTTFQHTSNNSTVAFSFAIEVNDTYIWSPRPVKHDMPNLDGHANLAGEGILPLPANTKISLWCASDKTGTLTLDTLSIIISKFAEL